MYCLTTNQILLKLQTVNMKTVSFRLTTILLLVFITSLAYSQDLSKKQLKEVLENSTEKELVLFNTSLLLNKSYYHGFLTAEKLLEFNPKNPNYNYRAGYSLMKISDDYSKSIPYLEIAVRSLTNNYDMVSKRENKAPNESLFFMGKAYHLANQLDKAKKFYILFLEKADNTNLLYEDVVLGLKQCSVAKKLVIIHADYEVKNIGSDVNTEFPEYSAAISLDGTSLYFTSRRLYDDSSNVEIKEPGTNMYLEDIYVSFKNEDLQWSSPKKLDFCQPEYNEASVSVSIDERRIYTYKDQKGKGDLYYSNSGLRNFQELETLENNMVNTDAWETHISVAPDGMKKYFVSDREGGFGGRDIYMIKKNEDNQWSDPINLGETVNSSYDEDSPFMSIDNKTMYFSNNGPKSMGGFDIFKTTFSDSNTWSQPENLGYPLNSTSDEIYYTTTADGTKGYFTSFRDLGFGDKDIYEVTNNTVDLEEISVFLGEIVSTDISKMPEDLSFFIKCLDCDEPYEFVMYPRFSDGTFFASLYACKEYEITLRPNSGNEEISKEIIKTGCGDEYKEIYRYIFFESGFERIIDSRRLIDSYSPLAMKHFFSYNKNKINTEKGSLNIFLDSIKSQLNRGRTSMEIEISSSASNVPTSSYKDNNEVALKRAENIKAYLTAYFKSIGISDSIKLIIKKTQVAGPEYDSDYKKEDKYIPYQYVELLTRGINSLDLQGINLTSIDNKIEGEFNDSLSSIIKIVDNEGDYFTSGEINEEDYDFHVIVGVFQKLSFAKGMVKSTKSKGFNAEIIGKRKGLHAVSAGKVSTKAEATKILKRARKEVVQSAWILNLKN